MSDIIERLRDRECKFCDEAIGEITRLRRVNAGLVEAMQAYLDYCRPNLEGEPILMRIREKMHAALRVATEGAEVKR